MSKATASKAAARLVLIFVSALVAACSSGGAASGRTPSDPADTQDRTATAQMPLTPWPNNPTPQATTPAPTVRTSASTDSGSRYAATRDPLGHLAVETDPLSGLGRVADAGFGEAAAPASGTIGHQAEGFPPPSIAGSPPAGRSGTAQPPSDAGAVRSSADLPAPFAPAPPAPPPPTARNDR